MPLLSRARQVRWSGNSTFRAPPPYSPFRQKRSTLCHVSACNARCFFYPRNRLKITASHYLVKLNLQKRENQHRYIQILQKSQAYPLPRLPPEALFESCRVSRAAYSNVGLVCFLNAMQGKYLLALFEAIRKCFATKMAFPSTDNGYLPHVREILLIVENPLILLWHSKTKDDSARMTTASIFPTLKISPAVRLRPHPLWSSIPTS